MYKSCWRNRPRYDHLRLIYQFCEYFIAEQFYKSFFRPYYIKWLCYPNVMNNNPITYPTFTTRAERQTKKDRVGTYHDTSETIIQPLFYFFKNFENPVQETLHTLHSFLISILTKMVRSRCGKTMGESSSKERPCYRFSTLSEEDSTIGCWREYSISNTWEEREDEKI